jgi:hypothetical protein
VLSREIFGDVEISWKKTPSEMAMDLEPLSTKLINRSGKEVVSQERFSPPSPKTR